MVLCTAWRERTEGGHMGKRSGAAGERAEGLVGDDGAWYAVRVTARTGWAGSTEGGGRA